MLFRYELPASLPLQNVDDFTGISVGMLLGVSPSEQVEISDYKIPFTKL